MNIQIFKKKINLCEVDNFIIYLNEIWFFTVFNKYYTKQQKLENHLIMKWILKDR